MNSSSATEKIAYNGVTYTVVGLDSLPNKRTYDLYTRKRLRRDKKRRARAAQKPKTTPLGNLPSKDGPTKKKRAKTKPAKALEKKQMGKKLPSSIFLYNKARELQENPTKSEQCLWDRLQNEQLGAGFSFNRPFRGRYILDFYCKEKRLAVELDGKFGHEGKEVYDKQRDEFIQRCGVRVLRIPSHRVFTDFAGVIKDIQKALEQ